ncbi:MAG: hypothetical protein PHG81_04820 [Aliarcobacter sp.]|nr:hypothetical protein [Aliarcobacter sp.]
MKQKLILLILICIFARASTLKIDDKISSFSLPNQFDKIHTINSEISKIIVTSEKENVTLINDFLSSKNSDFLDKNHTVFIDNISKVSSLIVKMFVIPKLREYDYDILLIYNENSKKFLEQENKISVYIIENAKVTDIKYISSKEELERIFK